MVVGAKHRERLVTSKCVRGDSVETLVKIGKSDHLKRRQGPGQNIEKEWELVNCVEDELGGER
jgi:hypothetical protein